MRKAPSKLPAGHETTLADQVRRWWEKLPGKSPKTPDLVLQRPGSVTLIECGVRDVERLRRRFPQDRVRDAWRILEAQEPDRHGARFEDLLSEQVYRAHDSSLKIQRSWRRTVTATRALARLFDLDAGAAPDGGCPAGNEQEFLRAVWTRLWPSEKLEDLLPLVASPASSSTATSP